MIATPTRRRKRISERATAAVGRVDEEAGILRGVKLLGRHSKNGREYSMEAIRNAKDKYVGKKVHIDHPLGSEDRTFDRWAGVIESVELRSDGLYGDVRLRRKGPMFAAIIEAATDFPESFGLSHVAEGDLRYIDGREIIEEITEVLSVDLVTEPASTAGLFEAVGSGGLGRCIDAVLDAARRARSGDTAALEKLHDLVAKLDAGDFDSDRSPDDDHLADDGVFDESFYRQPKFTEQEMRSYAQDLLL